MNDGSPDKLPSEMDLLQRHNKDEVSKVRAKVLRNLKRASLQDNFRENVEAGSEMFTDSFLSYEGINPEYAHNVINHAEKYVDGHMHVNGIENFWALLKRCLKGTYVSVEPFQLFRYLDEQVFRFNNRKLSSSARFVQSLKHVAGRRLTYKDLIGKTPNSPEPLLA